MGQLSSSIASMQGLARMWSGTRRRNLLHAWVSYHGGVSLATPHWVELRWVPSHMITHFLRAHGGDFTRMVLDAVRQEGRQPYIGQDEQPMDDQLMVIPPGYTGWVQRQQHPPPSTGMYPSQDEVRLCELLQLAYAHYVAEQVTTCLDSLCLTDLAHEQFASEVSKPSDIGPS